MSDTPVTAQKVVNILLVEDSPTQLEALRFLLEESGFAVVAATNGKEGLAAAKANEIDLVISDIVMPEMDGYALCKALRANGTLRRLPVILLTSLSDPRDVIQGLESGADNFICKPYEDHELLARVRNVLTNQEIRKTTHSEMGINIFFAGQRFFITADRLQILDLLLSTYENAVNRNNELIRTRDELRILNEQLDARVAERTKTLLAEIAERKQAEQALTESEARFRIFTERTPDGVFLVNEAGRYTQANGSACRITGYSQDELLQMSIQDLVAEESREDGIAHFRRVMETGVATSDLWHKRKDGSTCCLTVDAVKLSDTQVLGFCKDVTARKRAEDEREKLEEQLRTSQKMEAIGSLAGGVAHDFNNLLSVILSYTGIAIKGMREGDPIRDDLLEVKKAGERAAALTRQLLAFSRKQVLQPVPLDLNQIAAGVEKMLRRILGEDIDFVQVLAPDLGLTLADPGQMEQVLMNLAVNARDAMLEGGKLTIETSNVEVDEEYAAAHVAVTPGPYVQIAVTDTGCGMDEQTRTRIFEPFFTTKEKGKGTGLGLSTVYGIVTQSGGDIWVYSEPGRGTTFKIYLPRNLSATAATAIKPVTIPTRRQGTETILVVEDEEPLRNVALRILGEAGYKVLTAADGDEALLQSAQHAGDIHLLLTDVVMPRMNGRVLAQALAKTRPALKVLYMSGYTGNAIVHHGVLDAGTHFLAKPFTSAGLVQKVREVLDEGVTNLTNGHEQGITDDAELEERPLDKDALRGLPQNLLGKLRRAVAAARYDELADLIETVRMTEPEVATGLRRMADLFDYDGMRELLGQWKEE